MRRGACVKCGSATVRAARNGVDLSGGQGGVKARLRPDLPVDFRGMVRTHDTDVWAFACTTCGYLELQLFDPAALAFVTERWQPVPPPDATAPP
ncbi:MAG: hypothetical protein KA758_13950 [Acidimicrobiales bacterium]|jgi:predicted nucleic-acid-binding Zn-ribbon protein|nr:hypothetical protein [Acidimicrobiales bacterium]